MLVAVVLAALLSVPILLPMHWFLRSRRAKAPALFHLGGYALVLGVILYLQWRTSEDARGIDQHEIASQVDKGLKEADERAKRKVRDEQFARAEQVRVRLCEASPKTIGEASALIGSNPMSCEQAGPRNPGWYRVSWSEFIEIALNDFGKDASIPRCAPTESIDASKLCPPQYRRGKGWEGSRAPAQPTRSTYNYADAQP